MWNTGFATTYSNELSALAMERYPTDNCFTRYGASDPNTTYHNPTTEFVTYMTHQAAINLLKTYVNSTAYAQTINKPFLMFETNTASCGGFTGISDAFAASLWALDYSFQLAYSNFSVAMFHTSGQNVSYNVCSIVSPFLSLLTHFHTALHPSSGIAELLPPVDCQPLVLCGSGSR